jgi:hypothetical protein
MGVTTALARIRSEFGASGNTAFGVPAAAQTVS